MTGRAVRERDRQKSGIGKVGARKRKGKRNEWERALNGRKGG